MCITYFERAYFEVLTASKNKIKTNRTANRLLLFASFCSEVIINVARLRIRSGDRMRACIHTHESFSVGQQPQGDTNSMRMRLNNKYLLVRIEHSLKAAPKQNQQSHFFFLSFCQ